MKPYCLFFLLVSLFSCHRGNPKVYNSSSNQDRVSNSKLKPLSWERELTEAKKDHEIYGAFQLSNDTIILLRRSIGIELSANRGKTWQWLGKSIYGINEFTVDDKGRWWGLERWKGIHESSYCRIHKSMDLGKTWEEYTFSTEVFFPYHISSNPHQPLSVTLWNNKVYTLQGSDPRHDWKYVKQLAKKEYLSDIFVKNYFVSRKNNKLYVKRTNGRTDTLTSFIKAWDIYQIEKYKNVIYVAGSTAEGNNSYFATVVNEHLLRDFTVPGVDINMTKKSFNRIILTSTLGAYLFQNDKLVHIFK